MELRRYREGDLDWIQKRVDFLHAGDSIIADTQLAAFSYAFTITHDHYPVAVTGCFKIFDKVWQCWMFASEDARECGLGFLRRTREAIKRACEACDVKRLNSNVDAGNAENIRFARILGFEPEFTQLNAGPGASGDIMGLVYWHGGKP